MEEDFLKQHNLDELIDNMFYPRIEIHKETLIDLLKDYKKQLTIHSVVVPKGTLVCEDDKKSICANPMSHECCNKHHKRI